MFGRLKSAKKLWSANKLGGQIGHLLASSLYFARDANGKLDPRMQNDEFVLSYIWGVIALSVEANGVNDQEESGYVIRQVFEHLFPGSGRVVAELCVLRASQKDKDFLQGMQLGVSEMDQVLNSGGEKIFKGLLDHVLANYGSD